MLISNFSKRLKEAMDIQNIKAAEIARRSEVLFENNKINKPITQPILSNYLNGKYEAKQDNVYALSLILNVDEAWLMGADVPMERVQSVDYDFKYVIKDESLMPLANIGDIAYLKKQDSYRSGQTILFSINNIEYIRKIIDKIDKKIEETTINNKDIPKKNDLDIIELVSPNPYFMPITMTRLELKEQGFRVLGKVVSTKNSSAYEK